MLLEDRQNGISQKLAAGHPLVVASAAVVVGAVEPAAGKGPIEPAEQLLVIGVHTQRDLRLPAVAAEVPTRDQQPEQETEREGVGLAVGAGCFTVMSHVEQSSLRISPTPAARRRRNLETRGLPTKSATGVFEAPRGTVGLAGPRQRKTTHRGHPGARGCCFTVVSHVEQPPRSSGHSAAQPA